MQVGVRVDESKDLGQALARARELAEQRAGDLPVVTVVPRPPGTVALVLKYFSAVLLLRRRRSMPARWSSVRAAWVDYPGCYLARSGRKWGSAAAIRSPWRRHLRREGPKEARDESDGVPGAWSAELDRRP